MDEIIRIIEDFAPPELAEPWDFVGLAVDVPCEVKKVMLALTVTDDVVKQARENSCDLIISHHPLFFVPFAYKDIPIYCVHTNLDRTQGGTTDALIKLLGYKPENLGEMSFLRYIATDTTVNDFVNMLKTISNNVRLVNNKNISELKKIAFCAGSGSDFISEAVANGADALVTGDLKFHTALESDIILFDIGHFESEIPVLKVLADLLKDKTEILFAEEKSPFVSL